VTGLPKDYLKYPKRAYGQDHSFYDWRQAKDRPKLKWAGGAKLLISFVVPLEFFPLNPSGDPFKHPGSMITPYPDLRHFTVRDYGNRVGVYRILEALGQASISAGFAVNGDIASRYPPLINAIKHAGHEIIAHGYSTDHIHHDGLTKAAEKALVKITLNQFDSLPSGWLSPARNQSPNTLDILSSAGISYCLDWEMDQAPVKAQTESGRITLIPNSYELSDFTLLHFRRQSEESWLKQILDSVDYLVGEYDRFGGQCLTLTLTPYIMGQPFRIWALRDLLGKLASRDDVKIVPSENINRQFGGA